MKNSIQVNTLRELLAEYFLIKIDYIDYDKEMEDNIKDIYREVINILLSEYMNDPIEAINDLISVLVGLHLHLEKSKVIANMLPSAEVTEKIHKTIGPIYAQGNKMIDNLLQKYPEFADGYYDFNDRLYFIIQDLIDNNVDVAHMEIPENLVELMKNFHKDFFNTPHRKEKIEIYGLITAILLYMAVAIQSHIMRIQRQYARKIGLLERENR